MQSDHPKLYTEPMLLVGTHFLWKLSSWGTIYCRRCPTQDVYVDFDSSVHWLIKFRHLAGYLKQELNSTQIVFVFILFFVLNKQFLFCNLVCF